MPRVTLVDMSQALFLTPDAACCSLFRHRTVLWRPDVCESAQLELVLMSLAAGFIDALCTRMFLIRRGRATHPGHGQCPPCHGSGVLQPGLLHTYRFQAISPQNKGDYFRFDESVLRVVPRHM